MTKKEFEKLSEELNTDICREIAYEYAVFVPKDEEKAISKFRSLVKLSDQRFLDKNVLENANGNPIFPYNIIMVKIDQMVESYYQKFAVGMNTKETLTKYGSRGEKFYTYFTDCIKDSENTTRDAIKKELTRRLGGSNDVKIAIKGVGDVINRRTRSLDTLLESLSKQMERYILLWEYQDKGYTKYRINATGESCDACQNMNGKILAIADTTIDETLPPFHPNCDCTIEILDAQENVIHTQEKTAQDEQEWGKYLQSSFDQLIFGNYTDDVTLFGTLLQVLAGLIGVDLPMDVRDLFYDVTNFELTKEHIGQTLLDAVALLPVVGGVKYVDEAGDVIKSGAKSIDEAMEVIESCIKSIDETVDALKAGVKSIDEAVDAIESGVKSIDETVEILKTTDKTKEFVKNSINEGTSNILENTMPQAPERSAKAIELLSKVTNPKLTNTIKEMYRPGAKVGDGGLADAIKEEIRTGQLVGGKSHIQKGIERLKNLENILSKQSLTKEEIEITKKLIEELRNALELGERK